MRSAPDTIKGELVLQIWRSRPTQRSWPNVNYFTAECAAVPHTEASSGPAMDFSAHRR
jgi:hypothetical protein